jgi:hypothetical protein
MGTRVIEASLLEFLRDGLLAGVGLYMSRAEVSFRLGVPDLVADTDPSTGLPMLYHYHELSVGFSRADARVFFIQVLLATRGATRVRWRSASGPVEPCVPLEEMMSYLDEHSVAYTTRRQAAPKIVTHGGVVLTYGPLGLQQMLLGVVDV